MDKSPKQWVVDYMENMFNDGEHLNREWDGFQSWPDFFSGAVNGAYDWSEVLYDGADFDEVNRFRDRILKTSPRGFSDEKKFFNNQREGN